MAMRRRVFFSFHYQRDHWRVSQVRNSQVTLASSEFIDAASWEKIQRKGDKSIRTWIDSNLARTSVTVVLIGRETANRPWVNYEIERSHYLNHGLLGIYIDDIKNQHGKVDWLRGDNPFDNFLYDKNTNLIAYGEGGFAFWRTTLSSIIPTYSWAENDGRNSLTDWIESAAQDAKRRQRLYR